MPLLQLMCERANRLFGSEHVAAINVEDLKIGDETDARVLSQIAARLEIAQTNEERAALDRLPQSLKVALIAVARAAVLRSQGKTQKAGTPITFSWMSSYD